MLFFPESRIRADEQYVLDSEDLGASEFQSEHSAYIVLESGHLTVSAGDMSLRELIERIGAEAGFEVIVLADFDEYIDSWSISGVPLNEAVKALLRGTSAVVAYGPPEPGAESGNIVAIYLLGAPAPGQLSQGQPSSEPDGRLRTLAPTQSNQILLDEALSGAEAERIQSIDRLVGLTDDIAVEQLTFSLEFDPDADVRKRAAHALADIGGEVAATALEKGLGDSDASVRTQTMKFLIGIDDERITLWLGQMLMGDTDTQVRLAAVEALAGRGDETAARFLQAASEDRAPLVRKAAARFLEPGQKAQR